MVFDSGVSPNVGSILYAVLQVFTSFTHSLTISLVSYMTRCYCLQVVVTALGASLIDRTGRRPLLVVALLRPSILLTS
jgi:hypothetical protein